MKKYIYYIFCLILIFSCNLNKVKPSEETTSSYQNNSQTSSYAKISFYKSLPAVEGSIAQKEDLPSFDGLSCREDGKNRFVYFYEKTEAENPLKLAIIYYSKDYPEANKRKDFFLEGTINTSYIPKIDPTDMGLVFTKQGVGNEKNSSMIPITNSDDDDFPKDKHFSYEYEYLINLNDLGVVSNNYKKLFEEIIKSENQPVGINYFFGKQEQGKQPEHELSDVWYTMKENDVEYFRYFAKAIDKIKDILEERIE